MTRAPASGDDAPAAGPFAPSSTGAVAATRYVGGTASVAPTTGTFAVGDFVITQTGGIYVCTVAGTPGTWVAAQPRFGNSAAATTPGTVTKKVEVFDAAGVSLGFVAIYDAIT